MPYIVNDCTIHTTVGVVTHVLLHRCSLEMIVLREARKSLLTLMSIATTLTHHCMSSSQ